MGWILIEFECDSCEILKWMVRIKFCNVEERIRLNFSKFIRWSEIEIFCLFKFLIWCEFWSFWCVFLRLMPVKFCGPLTDYSLFLSYPHGTNGLELKKESDLAWNGILAAWTWGWPWHENYGNKGIRAMLG